MRSYTKSLTQSTTHKRMKWLNTNQRSISLDSVKNLVNMSNILRDILESTNLRRNKKSLKRSRSTMPGLIMPQATKDITKLRATKLANRDISEIKRKILNKLQPKNKLKNITLKRSIPSLTLRRRLMPKLSMITRLVPLKGPSKRSMMRSKPNKKSRYVINQKQ